MKNKKITIESLAVMVQKGFEAITAALHGDMKDLRIEIKGEMQESRNEVGKRFEQVNDQFLNVNSRLDSNQLDFSMLREDRHRIALLENDVAALKKK